MNTVYLLKNQDNQYLDKSGEWVPGDNQKSLYRSVYKDEALNQKAEFSVKNFELRITIAEAKLDEKGRVMLDDSEHAPDNIVPEKTNNIVENIEAELVLDESDIVSSAESLENEEVVDETNNGIENVEANVDAIDTETISTESMDAKTTNPEAINSEAESTGSEESISEIVSVIENIEISEIEEISETQSSVTENQPFELAADDFPSPNYSIDTHDRIIENNKAIVSAASEQEISEQQKGTNLESIAPEGEAITQLQDEPTINPSESIDASHVTVEPIEAHNKSLFEQDASNNDNPIEQAIH